MNGTQKVIKVFAICLAIIIIINIFSAILFGLSLITNIGIVNDSKVSVENFSKVYQDVNNIEIDSISSDIIIKSGDEFKVEASNIKYNFTSKLKNGTLKIEENKVWFLTNESSGIITVYIPKNINKLKIDSGAGKILVDNITSDYFDIDQGAGKLTISKSEFNKVDIDGGAGEIEVLSSKLREIDLDAGVGKIKLEAEITGNSKIECGIGEIDITLLGNKEDYTITAEKGIGSIKIDSQEQKSNIVYGTGRNKIDLEGGIGSINIDFKKSII